VCCESKYVNIQVDSSANVVGVREIPYLVWYASLFSAHLERVLAVGPSIVHLLMNVA
jgi:hypothetical protein